MLEDDDVSLVRNVLITVYLKGVYMFPKGS